MVIRDRLQALPPVEDDPTSSSVVAIAPMPDGTVLVGERSGRIVRVSRDGSPPTIVRDPPHRSPSSPAGEEGWSPPHLLGIAATRDGGWITREQDSIRAYAPNGSSTWTAARPSGRAALGADAIRITADGGIWLGLVPELERAGAPIAFPRPVFGRLEPGLGIVDTLWVPDRFTARCPTLSSWKYQSGRFEDIRERYFPKVRWALTHAGGLVVGCPATYEVELLGSDAEAFARITHPFDPIDVSRDEQESFLTTWAAQMNHSGRHNEPWHWDDLTIPPFKPAYQRFLTDDSSRVWVWRSQRSVATETPWDWPLAGLPDSLYVESDSGAFDAFSPDGSYLGTLPLAAGMVYSPFSGAPEPVIVGDTLWAVLETPGAPATIARVELRWE